MVGKPEPRRPAGAIFNALTLNALLHHSDWVTLANMTGLMHGGGIEKPNGVVIVDPQYYTQQLYAAARPVTRSRRSGLGRAVTCPGAATCQQSLTYRTLTCLALWEIDGGRWSLLSSIAIGRRRVSCG